MICARCHYSIRENDTQNLAYANPISGIIWYLIPLPPSPPPPSPHTCPPSSTSTPLLLPPTQIPPTKRLRPPLHLLLLPQPLQLLRIQSRIPPLGPIHTLLAGQIPHAAEDAAAREGAADAFGDAALDRVDVFVAGEVGG
jgi:hypothetical protein